MGSPEVFVEALLAASSWELDRFTGKEGWVGDRDECDPFATE